VVSFSDYESYELDADVDIPDKAFDALEPIQEVLSEGEKTAYHSRPSIPDSLMNLEQCVAALEGSIPLMVDTIVPSGGKLVFIEAGYLECNHSNRLGVKSRVYDEETGEELDEVPDLVSSIKRRVEQETSATLK
jgi:hypothetical protein